jgi:hypothetical protein
MPLSSRDDFLLRIIRQVMDVIARAVGLRREGRLDEAERELESAMAELLGPLAAVAPRVDPATAAQMVAHPERILALARLTAELAEVQRDRGLDVLATPGEARALALVLEAVEREPRLAVQAAELARGLLSRGAGARLEPHHAALLVKWDPGA